MGDPPEPLAAAVASESEHGAMHLGNAALYRVAQGDRAGAQAFYERAVAQPDSSEVSRDILVDLDDLIATGPSTNLATELRQWVIDRLPT